MGTTTTTAAAAAAVSVAAATASASASAAASASVGTTRKEKTKHQRQYVRWEHHPDILQAHVDARNNQLPAPTTTYPRPPPRSTITDYMNRLKKHEAATGEKLSVAD